MLLVVAILLLVPAIFFDTTAGMVRVWLVNETYTHGFLILPISLWLVWQNRQQLAALTPQADFRALIVLIPCLLGWLLATLVDVQLLRQLGMIALIPITVWLICGLPVLMTLLFPLLYLFFAVPIGQSLIPPLMEFTADFTVYGVRALGVPVFREGLSFSLPTGNWVVVEECSGLRYLIASAALGTIYAYLSYRSYLKRSLFILAALITPIIANGLRAWMIVMIGHVSDMRYAVGLDHLLYGWVFFGIVITLMFYVGSFWADPQVQTKLPPQPPAADKPRGVMHVGKREVTSALVAVLLFAGITVFTHTLHSAGRTVTDQAQITLPATMGDWQPQARGPVGDWTPLYHNPDQTLSVTYGRGVGTVTLHIGYFSGQARNADPASTLNRLTDPYSNEWRLLGNRAHVSATGQRNEARVRSGKADLTVWQLWAIGDRWTSNPYLAKLYQAYGLIFMGRRDGAYVAISTLRDGDDASVQARLEEFWLAAQPVLQAGLAGVAP